MYERKCKNWLTEFARWTLPRSEAPETYIFWTGLFSLSAAIRRHVQVPKTYLGSWSVSPNLYVMFVADPGKRKTTTADYALELLQPVPDLTMAPDQVSMPKLLTTLVESPDSSMCIYAGEFGEFMVKSGLEMYSFLTNAYDGRKKITAGTHIRGVEFVEKPCINLLAATTPVWIADNMPESVLGGGFASRVIFIYEERVRRRQMFYRNLDYKAIDKIQEDLQADLDHIATQIHGDFTLTDDACDFLEGWYRANADKGYSNQYQMAGYYERKPAHIIKVAMLLKIAESDELVIDAEEFKKALVLIEQLEPKLPKTFQAVGKNPYTVDMRRILSYLTEHKKVERGALFGAFMQAATPAMLDELITGLIQARLVSTITEGSTTYYCSV